MRRYVLTGTPGAGKTTILGHLAAMRHPVVEEAATSAITAALASGDSRRWEDDAFVEAVVALQRHRQEAADRQGRVVFFDRSPVCTHALCIYLGRPVPAALAAELERIAAERVYRREVFFVRNLGFCVRTAARRISFEDSLRFERVHEESYRAFGYELVEVPAGPPEVRAAAIAAHVAARS